MKKVLTVIACGALVACSCNKSQWEEVDNVSYDVVVYDEPQAEKIDNISFDEPQINEPVATYVEQNVSYQSTGCMQPQPCQQVQPCYQPQPCFQATCGCQQMMPVEPKVTTTRKIITTTTTTKEPCSGSECEPVVTTQEEVLPAEVNYNYNQSYNHSNVQKEYSSNNQDYVEVTVEKNPYHSKVTDMRSVNAPVKGNNATQYSPEAYVVVATRATNRMLQDTSVIYDNGTSKTIYIKDTDILSPDLPYGSHRLKESTKHIIKGSKTYDVVNNIKAADFILSPATEWFVANDGSAPALLYKLSMYDHNGKKVNEWVEVIRQVKD